ncbi:MAG: M48 family metalloprotease [Sphingobacteriales bacterium]|nr:MAG: M48 family metalloprotease [Sphingobacteriales bacterium]
MKRTTTLIIIGIFSIFVILSCAVNPVTGKKQINFMSESQEIATGKESDPAIIAQFSLYPNDTFQKFINQKGQEMVKVSHRPDLPFQFRLLDSDVLNAFAVPGGYVYFTRGIMAYFNNEAQFAGVLGHEIGHVTARHSAQQYTKQMLSQVALVGGMIFSEKLRGMSEQAMQGMQLLFLKFSRDDETESDKLGVNYSSSIGYDAKEMADFFNTLGRASGGEEGRVPEFMSTHPDPGNRYVNVKNLAAEWQKQKGVTNLKVNRNEYLKMIDGLVYGEDPRQGYLDKTTNIFYQPEMKFQYPIPKGWQYQNSPTQVQAGSADGNAMLTLTLSSQKTLQAAADEIIKGYQLKLLTQGTSTKINGLDAYHFISQYGEAQTTQQTTSTQQQQVLAVHTTLISFNNNIYVFLGLTDMKLYDQYKASFVSATNGFKQITDAKKIDVSPERIKIVQTNAQYTLAQILSQQDMPTARHEELAILNGMNTTTVVPAGTLIKVLTRKK